MILLALLAACRSGSVDVKQDDTGPGVPVRLSRIRSAAEAARLVSVGEPGASDTTA